MPVKDKVRQITMVNLSDIQPAGFNPPDRVERQNLRALRDAILQVGEIINPVILSRDLHIIDGHRRVAVARDLGWTAVPAITVEYGLQEGWSILNGATRPITAGDYLSAAANGMDTRHMPKKHATKIERLRSLVDTSGLLMLAERKKSTWLLTLVVKAARAIGDESNEYMGDMVRWIAKHDMQYATRQALESGDIESIAYAVANDMPIAN